LEEGDGHEEEEINPYEFTVEVTKHDKRQIEMALNFTHPGQISAGNNKDILSVKVLEFTLFKSASSFKPIDESSFEKGNTGGKDMIYKAVPSIITDKKQAVMLAESADFAEKLMNWMNSGNFIVSLILGGSMQ